MALGKLIVSALCCCAAFACLSGIRRARCRAPFPPTPPPSWIPFVGNALQMPTRQEWLEMAKWARELGPVFMINALGSRIIFISTPQIAQDLFVHRSKDYSDRPQSVMVSELMGWKFAFSLMNFTDPAFSVFRRIFVREFSSHTMNTYREAITHETHTCLRQLVQKPEDFRKHLYNQVVGSNMAIAYGYPNAHSEDAHVQAAEKAMQSIVAVMRPGSFWLVNVFPLLKYIPPWFPGANFRRVAQEGHKLVDNMRTGVLEWSLEQHKEGKTQSSFFTRLMDSYQNGDISLDIVRDSCAAFHSVASDTTISALLTFVLAMLHAPEVQARAQQELDSVTGGRRLPDFSDRASLPYIDALVKEVLRWHPVAPFGLPHVSRVNYVYNGMFIPANTVILPNQYAMCYDDTVYPEPHVFRPERFMGANKQQDPDTVAFGFGARICPGRHLAQLILWLDFASILSCFTIERPRDEDGKEYLPPREFTSGLTSHPEALECRFVPRPGWSAVIQDSATS
ncbi:unnamed protein product [Peniophora sp. CBMAI 1063]|nr:unnamed protein product [Peniophora sp. CBMAI 1063]